MSRNILVGYDGSASARRALQYAVDDVLAAGGRVRVLMVVQPALANMDAVVMRIGDHGVEEARQQLATLQADYPQLAGRLEVDVVEGNPGDVLLEQVQAHGCNHIVIGHTERGALARWLLGSVSTEVLGKANVPVTVVR